MRKAVCLVVSIVLICLCAVGGVVRFWGYMNSSKDDEAVLVADIETMKPDNVSEVCDDTGWGATVVNVIESVLGDVYITSDGWRIGYSKLSKEWTIDGYKGMLKEPRIPTVFRGNRITKCYITENSYVEQLTIPDCMVYAAVTGCSNLKVLTLGKGINELTPCMINYCYGLKELNIMGTLTRVCHNFVDGGAHEEEYFNGDNINFYVPQNDIEVLRGMDNEALLELINDYTYKNNDFKAVNFV